MSLITLTSKDFTNENSFNSPHSKFGHNENLSNNKPILYLQRNRGLFMVLFYSPNCEFCHEILNIFNDLPVKVRGCNFGVLNIEDHIQPIKQSLGTTTEIKVVPYILLFKDGRPNIRYSGPPNIDSVIEFINDVSNFVFDNFPEENFTDTNQDENQDNVCVIPEYCIAKPYEGIMTNNKSKKPKCGQGFMNAY